MTTDQGILDEIRDSIDEGATLSAVTSTEDRLVLVLGHEQTQSRYRLDPQATRHLLQADLIDQLTSGGADRREAIVNR